MFGLDVWPVEARDIHLYTIDGVAIVLMAVLSMRMRKHVHSILLYLAIVRMIAQAYITYQGHQTEVTMVYITSDQVLFKAMAFEALRLFCKQSNALAVVAGLAYVQFVSYYTWHETLTDNIRLIDNAVASAALVVAAGLNRRPGLFMAALCMGGNLVIAYLIVNEDVGGVSPYFCRAAVDTGFVIGAWCLYAGEEPPTAEVVAGEEDEEEGTPLTAAAIAGVTCNPLTVEEIDERLFQAAPATPTAPVMV